MVQYIRSGFDASFAALSDATRRGVLEQLGRADASITDLAEKFHMTLTGMKNTSAYWGSRKSRLGSMSTVESGLPNSTSWTEWSRN